VRNRNRLEVLALFLGLKTPCFVSGNVEKHVATVGELSRMVSEKNLMKVSEVEQDLACSAEKLGVAYDAVSAVVEDPRTRPAERLRLALLFVLRYEDELEEDPDTLDRLKDLLFKHGIEHSEMGLLRAALEFAGERRRTDGLFGGGGGMSQKLSVGALKKSLKEGLVGVDNVYTRHSPLLASTIEALFSRTGLPAATHPLLKAGGGGGGESPTRCHEAVRGAHPAASRTCVAQLKRVCGAGGVHRGRCDVRGGDGRGAMECGAERLEPAARYAAAPETHPHPLGWPFGG